MSAHATEPWLVIVERDGVAHFSDQESAQRYMDRAADLHPDLEIIGIPISLAVAAPSVRAALNEMLKATEDGWGCDPLHAIDCCREACNHGCRVERWRRLARLGDARPTMETEAGRSGLAPPPAPKEVEP